ncbi:hypothetical protein Tco_1477597, partial [Tanacetum coccineum]
EKIVEGEDEESYASEFADTVLLDKEDSSTKIEPVIHKDKPKNIDDDADDEMKDDKKDDNDDDDDYDDHALIRNRGMGSSEIRNEKMQTTIPSPPRSPKKDLSSNKAIDQELTASSFYDTSNGKEICTNRDFQDSSCRDDAFYKHDHDDHQGDDAPPEGEKSAKRHKTSKSLKSARGSSSKQPIKDTNTLRNRMLSYDGRIQLIALFLSSMQVYWASVYLLLTSMIKEIGKLLKRFLLNFGHSARGRAKVSQSLVCTSKEQGDSLWVKWVNTVIRDKVKPFVLYAIRDGRDISMCHEKWCSNEQIDRFVPNRAVYEARFKDNDKVVDLVSDSRWKWPIEWNELYLEIKMCLCLI